MKGKKPSTAECEFPVSFYVRHLLRLLLIAGPDQNPSGMCCRYEAIRNNVHDSSFLGMSTNISQHICGFPQSVNRVPSNRPRLSSYKSLPNIQNHLPNSLDATQPVELELT